MIQKYYNSILEQVFAQIGKKEHNIVLAKYSNDFSLKQLEISEQITNNKKVHFAAHEFRAEKLSGAYEPFLDLILELFDQQKEMTFDEFHLHLWMLTLTVSHLILGYGVPMILRSILYEIYV